MFPLTSVTVGLGLST